MKKQRLDVLLVQRNMAPSREKAKALIMSGEVFVNGQREDKPGTVFAEEADIEVKAAKPFPYVSRGGLKLEKAVQAFGLVLQGKCCLDVGASTGGFTDVMLQNGAQRVYAIDVGYGQLAWKLREDPRVTVMEKTNIRYVKPEDIGEKADFASVDVSFISLTKVLPAARELLTDEAEMVCLIKPQFEAGRGQVGKKGVVRDPAVHREVIEKIVLFAEEAGFVPLALSHSPIRGPEGNIEYLLHIRKKKGGDETAETGAAGSAENGTAEAGSERKISAEIIAECVQKAHNTI